jgi:hypothetical protein
MQTTNEPQSLVVRDQIGCFENIFTDWAVL